MITDACPRCFPGDPAAAPALTTDGNRTSHRCSSCGYRWVTQWDASAARWPVTRSEAA